MCNSRAVGSRGAAFQAIEHGQEIGAAPFNAIVQAPEIALFVGADGVDFAVEQQQGGGGFQGKPFEF